MWCANIIDMRFMQGSQEEKDAGSGENHATDQKVYHVHFMRGGCAHSPRGLFLSAGILYAQPLCTGAPVGSVFQHSAV